MEDAGRQGDKHNVTKEEGEKPHFGALLAPFHGSQESEFGCQGSTAVDFSHCLTSPFLLLQTGYL